MFGIDNFIDGRSLQSLGNSVRQMFESISVQAQTSWTKQHKADGTHGDVTADSLSTPRIRLSMARGSSADGAIFVYDARNAAANGIPLTIAADVMWVSVIVPSPGPWLLRGIVQPGVRFGDVLFLRRDPRSGGNIEITDRDAANVPVGSEIHVPQDVSLSYPVFSVVGPTWVPLVYTPGAGTNSVPAWGLLQIMSA